MANKKNYYHRNKAKAAKSARLAAEQARNVDMYSQEQLSLSVSELGLSDATSELLTSNGVLTADGLVRRTEKDMYKIQGLNKRILAEVKAALAKKGMALFTEPAEKPEEEPEAREQADVLPTPQKQGRPSDGKQNAPREAKKGKSQPKATPEEKTDVKAKSSEEQTPRSKKQEPQKGTDKKSEEREKQKSEKDKAPKARQTKQDKMSEPLPVELWRKIMKGGKWGFTDGFKTVIPPMYDEVFAFKEGLAAVEIDGKCGYIDSSNDVVIPLEYDLAMSFSEGYAMVAKGEKCGYINRDNELVIACEYDAATPFEDGEAKVKKDGKWATLTPDGKLNWI